MNKGMTLIEVLVVIPIILIMLSAVMINPRPQADLDRITRELVSDIRMAQNMAMGVVAQDLIGPGVAPDMYGLQFISPNLYSVWYCGPGNWFNFKMVYLPPGVVINPVPGTNINFRVPDGARCLDFIPCDASLIEGCSTSNLNITFQTSDGSTRTVTVTSAGKIEIQ